MTATEQNFDVYTGTNVLPQWTVLNAAGAAIDLSTVSDIAWQAAQVEGGIPVLSKLKSTGGITFVTTGTDGRFQAVIAPSDLAGLAGQYLYTAQITDASGNVSTVVVGRMNVKPLGANTWTYSGDPQTSSKDTVRFLIGDTLSNDQQFQDAEILAALVLRPNPYGAGAALCRSLAARLSRKVATTSSAGGMTISAQQGAAAYRIMALDLEGQAVALGGAMPYAGGISIADKQAQETDDDRVSPAFQLGMMDNVLAGVVGNESMVSDSTEVEGFP